MDPIAFHIFNRPVYWYGILFALGFLAATLHWGRMAKKRGLGGGFGADMGFWIIIGGVVGARLAYVVANWKTYLEDPMGVFRIDQGGLIYYGGFLGAVVAVVLYARLKKQPLWEVADLAVSGLPLGHAFGRIGCFINHCCYGAVTHCPVSVELEGAHRHPVQLYEAAANLGLYAGLLLFYRKRTTPGTVFTLYLLTYPVTRFLLEFLRGDPRAHGLLFNRSQELSLTLLAVGVALFIYFRTRASKQADMPSG